MTCEKCDAALARIAQLEGDWETFNEEIALTREKLGPFDSERVSIMAMRAMERISQLENLARDIRGYMVPGCVMPVKEQAAHIVKWIDAALAHDKASSDAGQGEM